MKYIPLFSLELVHDYYADGLCPDFEIEPAPETTRLLENYRCLLRPLPNGIRILTQAGDQNTPLIPLPFEPTFNFQLKVRNPKFFLFTDYAEISAMAAPFFTNNPPGLELKLASRQAKTTEQFMVRKPAQNDVFVLGGRPLPGLTPAAFHVDGLGAASAPLTYAEATKLISINSETFKADDPFTVTYPSVPQLDHGVFVDVEIRYRDPIVGAGGPAKFQAAFKAKKVSWKYYIVTNKANNNSNIPAIMDRDNWIVFNPAGRTDLTAHPDPADKIAHELANQYPDLQIFRLVSNAPVACQIATRKNIQLQINGNKVIDPLPNPALENFVADGNGSNKENSLFHIIKQINH